MFVEEDEIKILKNNEMLKLKEKESKKVFTNEERNNIISKDYNPLKVNYKIYKRGSGLFMENETLSIVKKISKKYNKKEVLILEMMKKCKEMGYDIQSCLKLINEFYIL